MFLLCWRLCDRSEPNARFLRRKERDPFGFAQGRPLRAARPDPSAGKERQPQDDSERLERGIREWLTPLCNTTPLPDMGWRASLKRHCFGAYSKKVGMWLFLASDSLTFGALLFAFSYNRIYTVWPTPFGKDSIINATVMTACLLSSSLTMVMAVFAAQRSDRAWTRNWLLATMAFGTAFIVLHGMEWTKLIHEGLSVPGFPKPAGQEGGRFGSYLVGRAAICRDIFGLTAMHMLHVTIGVIYLGVVALRKWFLPILGVIWLAAFF